MQKKTALRTRSHRKVSPIKESGLTAKAKKAKRSAGTASALDNRSHMNAFGFSCEGISYDAAQPRSIAPSAIAIRCYAAALTTD